MAAMKHECMLEKVKLQFHVYSHTLQSLKRKQNMQLIIRLRAYNGRHNSKGVTARACTYFFRIF